MARRAAPVTKGRTSPKKPTVSDAATPGPKRRGAKSKPQDDAPMDLAAPVSIQDDAEPDVHEPEAPPSAKARRGRKPKADAVPTELADAAEAAMPEAPAPEALAPEPPAAEPELPAVQAKAPKPPSSPRKTRRNREPEASAPPPLDIADEPPAETHAAAAAQWHAETGTVTFDWPAIEQVAAAEGPNQPMAKLLLAARTEGATSRWPF